jgi:hypothetical protein
VDRAPAHLADPRALTILTTEHWAQLTARSLVYNEAFSRGSMFLTFLSASLVALGFVAGSMPSGGTFPLVVIAILALDLFVGLATVGRLTGAGREEIRSLQAMSRLRHAYLEIVPTLEPYLTDSPYDDVGSVLATYGATAERPRMLLNVAHGLTTMIGLVSTLDAALIGGLAATVAIVVGADAVAALVLGVVSGLASMIALSLMANAVFGGIARSTVARFPAPEAPTAGDQPSRRKT